MKYWKIVENLNDVSNQLFSSIYVNFLRIQTDGIIKWNHQPCPFCQMRQVHQTISCHLQFLYSSENIPINIINQHANPKIKFSSHVHEHIKKKDLVKGERRVTIRLVSFDLLATTGLNPERRGASGKRRQASDCSPLNTERRWFQAQWAHHWGCHFNLLQSSFLLPSFLIRFLQVLLLLYLQW